MWRGSPHRKSKGEESPPDPPPFLLLAGDQVLPNPYQPDNPDPPIISILERPGTIMEVRVQQQPVRESDSFCRLPSLVTILTPVVFLKDLVCNAISLVVGDVD